MKHTVALVLSILVLCANSLHRKHLAGPPSEFPQFVIPQPANSASRQVSAAIEVVFESSPLDSNQVTWTGTLPVDSTTLFSFNIFSPAVDAFQVTLLDPTGKSINLAQYTTTGPAASFPVGDQLLEGINYLLQGFPPGTYTLTISAPQKVQALAQDNQPNAIIFLYNESPVTMHTQLNTYYLHLSGDVGLVTRLTQDTTRAVNPPAMPEVISQATMSIRYPDGEEDQVPMHDDGLHADFEANDGIYGAFIEATEVGKYIATAILQGTDSNGNPILRSTTQLIPIVDELVSFGTTAFTAMKDKDIIEFFVPVSITNGEDKEFFKVFAQVWGQDSTGNDIAICWLGGIVDVKTVDGQQVVGLEMNINWLNLAGANAPFSLQNIFIQDNDDFIPLAQSDLIPVNSDNLQLPRLTQAVEIEITREMRDGKMPDFLVQRKNMTTSASTPNLLLVHGYCTNENPWQSSSAFTNGAYFLEAGASMSNDAFAKKVVDYAESLGMTSFGIIGHSQGGLVGAHMHNYFFTGLDISAAGGRKIQSVGSPYSGTTGAGSAANLIEMFGYGCGSNDDLTLDGAALWNVGITPDTRQSVYYYTTSYKQGSFFGDYCSLATNTVLEWPNDGVVEIQNSQLSGAVSLGNKEKWCHTTEMAYTAQYLDETRNQEMNKAAAR